MSIHAGIDLGTSGVKIVLIDAAQTVIADVSAQYPVSRPHPAWSEQDPALWWDAVQGLFDGLARSHPKEMAALASIGLSGQQHGATLLDAADRVLRPCILWNDMRAAEECAILDARADFRGIGANLVMPGFTAPKLEWVNRHEPEHFARVAKVLLPKDYLRLCLSGDHASDMSDSGGTLWQDVAGRCWSETLLAAGGMRADQMPRLHEGTEPTGTLRPELCSRWGITSRPVIAGGGGDNASSACGVGAIADGAGFVSLGTSGVVFVSLDAFAANTRDAVHAMPHAVPGKWHQMGVVVSAADSLSWLSEITGQGAGALAQAAEKADPAFTPVFLPYLSGERTPINDPAARGAFSGLTRGAGVAELAEAVLIGVAAALADSVVAFRAGGATIERLYAVGGGARSRHWLQRIADAAGVTLMIPARGEVGGAMGAARLGICATGRPVAEVLTPAPVSAEIHPDAGGAGRLAPTLARYRALYPALKGI